MNKDNNKLFDTKIYPRFTTEEMEKSQTRCGCEFKIISLFFDDKKPKLPTKVVGCIYDSHGKKVMANWNRHGECPISSSPMKPFDLIKFDDQKDNEVKPTIVGF